MDAVFHCNHGAIFNSEEYQYTRTFIYSQYTIDMHTHGFYELNIVLSGDGRHDIENMSCRAFPGCVFLIPPDVRHGYVSYDDLTVFHLVLHRDFLKECFQEFQKTAGFSLLFETEPYLRAHYEENMFLVLTPDEQHIFLLDINAIESCRGMNRAHIYADTIAKKILCHLCLLMEQRHGIECYTASSKKDSDTMLECLNYIHQNFHDPLPIAFLAQRANMSRSTFIRQFERTCGCSPHQYVRQYRLKKAREYLKEPGRSISAVAAECGFYDASHLRKQLETEENENSKQ